MKKQVGFTLIELMIVVAIVAILAAIAQTSYTTYIQRAKFSEIVTFVSLYKTTYEICIQSGNAPEDCTENSHGIPANIAAGSGTGYVNSVVLDASGVITATGTSDLNGATYQLSPTISSTGQISWTKGGTCFALGMC